MPFQVMSENAEGVLQIVVFWGTYVMGWLRFSTGKTNNKNAYFYYFGFVISLISLGNILYNITCKLPF